MKTGQNKKISKIEHLCERNKRSKTKKSFLFIFT